MVMKQWQRMFRPGVPQPDRPVPFGYKQMWFTIAASDPYAVARAFDLMSVDPCSWVDGVCLATPGQLFISPPVQQWIFAVGQVEPHHDLRPLRQRLLPLLNRLSAQFGVAHYFLTHRVIEHHAWARSESGALVRGYAYCGECGETLWNEGAAVCERALGLAFFDERSPEASDPVYWERIDLQFPDEQAVMQLARRWCLAPCDLLPGDSSPALGLQGTLLW